MIKYEDKYDDNYYKSLTEIEKTAFKIAKIKLGSSFIPEKTLGYIEFIKKLNEEKKNKNST